MAILFDFLRMMLAQQVGRQKLERVPEPSAVMDSTASVVQHDEAMLTKLAIVYAGGLEIVYRARQGTAGGSAIDLGCGPGHFTLCLARYLNYGAVVGIDLSPPMVEIATRNAAKQKLDDRVRFRVGDATQLDDIKTGEVELTTLTYTAHHLPDLDTVARVLHEMDRITKPEGLVVLMDLARLRTGPLTERYVRAIGSDYVRQGLPAVFQDFRNSMYAAWTAQELRQTIPTDTERWWCHLVPRGLPSAQVILGLPVGRKKVFIRSGLPWGPDRHPVPEEMRKEWKMMRTTLVTLGSRRLFLPRPATSS